MSSGPGTGSMAGTISVATHTTTGHGMTGKGTRSEFAIPSKRGNAPPHSVIPGAYQRVAAYATTLSSYPIIMEADYGVGVAVLVGVRETPTSLV